MYFQEPGAENILETVYLATILPAHHEFSIFLILVLLLERFARKKDTFKSFLFLLFIPLPEVIIIFP